jgi:hypothetical protein
MEHDIHRDIQGQYNVPWVDQSLYSPMEHDIHRDIQVSKDKFSIFPPTVNHIGGVMAGMLASRAVDLEVEPRSGQIVTDNMSEYKIDDFT